MTRNQLRAAILIGKLWLLLAELAGGAYSGVVMFCGDNCPPCQRMKPIVASLNAAGYKIATVNVSRQRDARYNGQGVPQFVVTSDDTGRVVRRRVGACSADTLRAFIDSPFQLCREYIAPAIYGEVQAQCPGGNCPPGRYAPREYAPYSAQQTQQSPEAPHHAGIVKVFFGNAGGSGTLIDAEGDLGTVVTAQHVIEGQPVTGTIVWPSGEKTGGRVIGADEGPDLAVLRVFLPQRYAVVPLAGDAEYAVQGDTVEICGYRATYQGRMCHFNARCLGYTRRDSARSDQIKVDARTVSGDSGGPIIHDGKVVAVLWGFTGGTDGTRAETQGACCIRVRQFLNRCGVGTAKPRGPPAPDNSVAPPLPGPSSDNRAPTADEPWRPFRPDLTACERALAAERKRADDLARQLEAANSKPPVEVEKIVEVEKPVERIKEVPGPERIVEKPVEKIVKVAEGWLSAKVLAVAAGFGIPGIVASLGLWVAKRRLKKRLKQWEGGDLSSADSPIAVVMDRLKKQINDLTSRLTATKAESNVRIAELESKLVERRTTEIIEAAPLPPEYVKRTENIMVDRPLPEREAESYREAIRRLIPQYGHRTMLFSTCVDLINGVKDQIWHGDKIVGSTQRSGWKAD